MSRTKKRTIEVAEEYVAEVKKRFPAAEPEIRLDSTGGYDLWIRVVVPLNARGSFKDILDATNALNEAYWQKDGVSIVSTVVDKEAAFSSQPS